MRATLGRWLASALAAAALASSSLPAAAEEFSVEALTFHPKSNALVLARGSGELRLIDFSDPAKPSERTIATKVNAAAFLSDGSGVVIGDEDGALRVRSLDGADVGAPIYSAKESIIGVAVSARGRYLAAVDRKLALRIWQAQGSGFRLALEIQLVRMCASCGNTFRGDGRVPGVDWADRADVAFAPDESMVAVISSFNNVYARRIDGRVITVPRANWDYESGCGVQVLFSANGRYLIAHRGAQPGCSAFVWSRAPGALAGGRQFPGVEQPREFAALPGAADLLVLDDKGLRRVTPGDPAGAVLLPADSEQRTEHFAVSADGERIVTRDDEHVGKTEFASDYRQWIAYRSATGAPLGRISPR